MARWIRPPPGHVGSRPLIFLIFQIPEGASAVGETTTTTATTATKRNANQVEFSSPCHLGKGSKRQGRKFQDGAGMYNSTVWFSLHCSGDRPTSGSWRDRQKANLLIEKDGQRRVGGLLSGVLFLEESENDRKTKFPLQWRYRKGVSRPCPRQQLVHLYF